MPLFIIIYAMKIVHYVAFSLLFSHVVSRHFSPLFILSLLSPPSLEQQFLQNYIHNNVVSTLGSISVHRTDECGESQGYLRGIRIPLLTLCNTLLFGKLTMAFPRAGVASLFLLLWVVYHPPMLKPLNIPSNHPIVHQLTREILNENYRESHLFRWFTTSTFGSNFKIKFLWINSGMIVPNSAMNHAA